MPLRGGAWPAAGHRCAVRPRPELLAADAQHRFHVRELDARDIEQLGDLLDAAARRALHVHAFERGAHLHLEEHAQQVGALRAGLGELRASWIRGRSPRSCRA